MTQRDGLYRKILDLPYGFVSPSKLYDAAKGNKAILQRLRLQVKLPVHNGCVNTICWNDNGQYILSGSDDQHLAVTHGYSHTLLASVPTGHRANIFSARFLPSTGDKQAISCSGDGVIIFSDLDRPDSSMSNLFSCHFGTAYEIMTVPNDPHTFLSCGEDGTVRWFDLRLKNRCAIEDCKEDILINCRCAVTSLAVNPLTPFHLGVGCADSTVRIFDRRMLGTRATGKNSNYIGSGIQAMVARFTVPEFEGRSHRITSLTYSPDGKEMLVSYSSDYVYLFEVTDAGNQLPKVLSTFGDSQASRSEGKIKVSKSHCRPLMKRLRVRGDWSDTGPNARPESEMRATGEQQPRSVHASLMQRMSDVLTRMFNSPSQTNQRSASRSSSPTSSHSHSDNENSGDDEGTRGQLQELQQLEQTIGDSNQALDEALVLASVEQATLPQEASSSTAPSADDVPCEDISKASVGDTATSVPCPSTSQSDDRAKPCSSQSGDRKPDTGAQDCFRTNCDNMPLSNVCRTESGESMEVEEEEPGKVAMSQHLENLKHELTTRRKDFLEKHNTEPMINLQYSGQGVNSGLIIMNSVSGSDRDHLSHLPSNQELQFSALQEHSAEGGRTQEGDREGRQNKPDKSTCLASGSSSSLVSQSGSEQAAHGVQSDKSYSDQGSKDAYVPIIGNELEPPSYQCDLGEQSESTVLEFVNSHSEESAGIACDGTSSVPETEEPLPGNESHDIRPRRNSSNPVAQDDTFLMEVDSWDVDSSSDDDLAGRAQGEQSSQRRASSESIPDSILRSIDEELRCRREEREREKAQMMNIPQPSVKQKFIGHRNARTMIKEATFWGNNFIMSGSDCGHIFVWDRHTTELVMIMEADHHVVNCLQPHPFDPLLASSGIDYDIKLWAPLLEEPFFDEEKATRIIRRNEVMLEETKDTITVPASFMIRMLASLNHLRSAGGISGWRRMVQDRDDSDASNH